MAGQTFEGRRTPDMGTRCGPDKGWMHAFSAWLAFIAMQHRHYCGVPHRTLFPACGRWNRIMGCGPAAKNGVGHEQ